MINAIINNPYRILGVYSNSPKKETIANKGKINAFTKVGRSVSFPLDLNGILPDVKRDEDSINHADSELSLPEGQIKHAQFWFIKKTPLDEVAFNHMMAGNVEKSIEIWAKGSDFSCCQNLIICYLIKEKYGDAFSLVELLYKELYSDFLNEIVGENYICSVESLIDNFIQELMHCKDLSSTELYSLFIGDIWKDKIRGYVTEPIIKQLNSAINKAKSKNNEGSEANLKAGTDLMNFAKPLIEKLKTILPQTDLSYQNVADNLGIQVLQCSINYFNDSKDYDAAYKTLTLLNFSKNIVVSQIKKDRCIENEKALKKIIQELPPKEIISECHAINEELRRFCRKSDKISYSIDLLKSTKPNLDKIKDKLGKNKFYLDLSTKVVANALHNVIKEVNRVIESNPLDLFMEGNLSSYSLSNPLSQDLDDDPYSKFLNRSSKFDVVNNAYEAIILMDDFDMDSNFKKNRYKPNRENFIEFYNNFYKNKDSDDSVNWGCIIAVIIAVIIFIISLNM